MNDYLNFAVSVAREAGDLLLFFHGKANKLDWKGRTDLKNEVDRKSDELIRRRIAQVFLRHNVLSEEDDPINLGSKFTWVVDPLDGTIGFTRGFFGGVFAVSIALAISRKPILGVIYAPKFGLLYTARDGKGAFCNGDMICVAREGNINHAVVLAGGGKETASFKRTDFLPYYQKLMSPDGVVDIVNASCGTVAFCHVAEGKLDAAALLSQDPWDMAAATCILREAGAKVTDIHGKEWELGDPSFLTANPELHKKFCALFSEI